MGKGKTPDRSVTVKPSVIAYYRTGPRSCACPDRYYRRRECKHIKALREAVEIVRAARKGREYEG